jgi:hypothetical protein
VTLRSAQVDSGGVDCHVKSVWRSQRIWHSLALSLSLRWNCENEMIEREFLDKWLSFWMLAAWLAGWHIWWYGCGLFWK